MPYEVVVTMFIKGRRTKTDKFFVEKKNTPMINQMCLLK